jgi:hypothetical protein
LKIKDLEKGAVCKTKILRIKQDRFITVAKHGLVEPRMIPHNIFHFSKIFPHGGSDHPRAFAILASNLVGVNENFVEPVQPVLPAVEIVKRALVQDKHYRQDGGHQSNTQSGDRDERMNLVFLEIPRGSDEVAGDHVQQVSGINWGCMKWLQSWGDLRTDTPGFHCQGPKF